MAIHMVDISKKKKTRRMAKACARLAASGLNSPSRLIDDIYIDDIETLLSINKLLVSVKKGRSNNLNAPLQIKAESYTAFDSSRTHA